MVIVQAYRFALDPAPGQERALRSHAGAARFAWNWALAACLDRYRRPATGGCGMSAPEHSTATV